MKLLCAIFILFFLNGCKSECNDFSIGKYVNDEMCKNISVIGDDRCISFVDASFFNDYGVFSFDYINDLDSHRGALERGDIVEKYGVYLLGVSILYDNESAVDLLLSLGVSPYETQGAAFAGVVFVVEDKNIQIWEIIKKYYPVDEHEDSLLVDRFLNECNQ
jgi:hypothetical protein